MSVFANNRGILHKGDGLTQVSGPPDVCKTPSPGGPVPIPYPNIAMNSDLDKGAKKVKIEGNPVAHAKSNLKTSTGDEAGTAGGGLMSSKTKGKLTFGTSSPNVKIEGQGAARFMEVTQHNGNTFNTVIVATGAMMPSYGDDPIDGEECVICGEAKAKHKVDADDDVLEKAGKLRDALKKPGGPFDLAFIKKPGSSTRLKKGVMIGVLSCQCDTRKQYAGLAGPQYDDGQFLKSANAFIAEAGKLGLIPVVTPPAPPPMTGFSPPSGGAAFGRTSAAQWEATKARVEAAKKLTGEGSNKELTCAAPKMIQKCLADGHKPGTMIEIWVGMKDKPATATAAAVVTSVPIPRVFGLVADNSTSPPTLSGQWQTGLEFGDGAAVPSCTTCQVTTTEMVCNLGKPPCP